MKPPRHFLYFDLVSGAAGDMLVAALLDLESDQAAAQAWLLEELKKLGLEETVRLSVKRVKKNTLSALQVDFATPADDWSQKKTGEAPAKSKTPHRSWAVIKELIKKSSLAEPVKEASLGTFSLLAQAEGAVHQKAPAAVHFHEVGSLDAILEVVSFFLLLERRKKAAAGALQLCGSTLKVGSGFVDCAHGRMPVPVPAVVELLRLSGVPFEPVPPEKASGELTTPTGAALLASCLSHFYFPAGPLSLVASGMGAGEKTFSQLPNLVRVMELQSSTLEENSSAFNEAAPPPTVVEIKTNLDDLSGEEVAYVSEQLLAAGALDVSHTLVTMKQGRPGVVLRVLAAPAEREKIGRCLLKHSSSLGYRYSYLKRVVLKRRSETFWFKKEGVAVAAQPFEIKIAELPEGGARLKVEDRSLRRALARPEVAAHYTYEELKKKVARAYEEQKHRLTNHQAN